ncbi:homoserine kinase [Candidatus Carsonella ruddii]|uniref:Putative homoserine kinase n=1 Tax=Candidatus Carsonella ruddii PC isolate NHV TaxID=1202540 RepID=J3YQZ8_CARRU|nr:homoserine kinase [Candidatus Carsonella ruddii]AFP84398.1 putative homoserine kinase [Candidatus Carsonella ruddii PC isolate NHV]
MFIYKNYHFLFLFFKLNIKLKFKKINYGTNSTNFFFLNKNAFFLSFIKKIKIIKILTIKIFQNNFLLPTINIILNKNNLVLYKKNIGIVLQYSCFYNVCKIVYYFKKKFFKKKNNQKKYCFFFLRINKNLISKISYFKKKIKNSSFINHNDIFKDNILFYGNTLTSIIDFNNYNYLHLKIDFEILKLEWCCNYFINYILLFEKLNDFKKNNFCVFMFYFSRIKNLKKFKKTKSYNSYIKKIFYD